MNPASYVVIRYIADPARNEPLNVGVLAWAGRRHELAIDTGAVARVVRENPRLHPDALMAIGDVVAERLGLQPSLPGGEIKERLAEQSGFPITFTEPRMTTIAADSGDALKTTVESLLTRIVRPRRRSGRGGMDLAQMLERRLQPLVRAGSVQSNHLFRSTQTGVIRRVDYFANSGANLALDTIKLDLRRADEIRLRADAEAFKVTDIASRNDVRVVVLTSMPVAEDLLPTANEARLILASTPAEIVTDIDEAVQMFNRVVGH